MTLEALLTRAQSLTEATALHRKRRFYRVGQQSRRPSGLVFVKTDRGWRRLAKNPRTARARWYTPLLLKAKKLLSVG